MLASAFFIAPETDMQSYDAAAAPMPDHESASRMTEEAAAEASPAADAGWKVESVTLKRTENGGVIATCSKTKEMTGKDRERYGSRDYQSKDYAFSSIDEALAYAGQELNGPTSSNTNMNKTPVPRA